MALGSPRVGLGFSTDFQSSALPWLTSSLATTTPAKFSFHKVSRFITLMNLGAATDYIKIGFTENGVKGNNYFKIAGSSTSHTLEFRVKEIWISSDTGSVPFSMAVGLTNIDESAMPQLSGTLYDNTPGWEGVG
jgi:hypothetical protein